MYPSKGSKCCSKLTCMIVNFVWIFFFFFFFSSSPFSSHFIVLLLSSKCSWSFLVLKAQHLDDHLCVVWRHLSVLIHSRRVPLCQLPVSVFIRVANGLPFVPTSDKLGWNCDLSPLQVLKLISWYSLCFNTASLSCWLRFCFGAFRRNR